MTSERYNKLDWLAFQYIADEMATEDRATFEHRLADDQAAREAVARAVELTQALLADQCEKVLLSSDPIRSSSAAEIRDRARARRRLTWLGLSLAMCFLLLIGSGFFTGRFTGGVGLIDQPRAESDMGNAVETSQLAIAWSNARVELDVADEEPFADPDGDFGTDAVSTPDWMLAAVAGLAEKMDETEGQ